MNATSPLQRTANSAGVVYGRAISALLVSLLAIGCAATPPQSARAGAPAESGGEHESAIDAIDASEIAARAVASVLQGTAPEASSDLAASSYDAVVRDLLLKIETLQKEHGHVTRELEAPFLELGRLYASANQCQNAIPMFRQAILLVQRLDGVMAPRQVPLYEPLLECYVELDMLADMARALAQILIVRENEVGKDDARMIPALMRAGAWHEETGQYEEARSVYIRAIDIARKAGGPESVRAVNPLRGLARTYRLQMQYENEAWRARGLEAQGQKQLERAATIVRAAPDASQTLKVNVLLELADWIQMSGAVRDAQKAYKEVWDVAHAGARASAATGGSAGGSDATAEMSALSTILSRPEPILYRAAVGEALRRSPRDTEKLKHYWIDYEFTVTRFGEVRDVYAREATAPEEVQRGIAENIKRTRYRPRFVEGVAVDTEGVVVRQGVWVQ